MKILVCLKQILDPEVPVRDFRIDAARRQAERGSANLVTNIFCENALETALQLREANAEARITALTYGPPSVEAVVRKALAMKVDSAALVLNQEKENPDPLTVARVLAAGARQMGPFDVVLVGREAGDWGAGQTGALLAEELGAAFVAFVDKVERAGSSLKVRRQTDSGCEILEVEPPAVLTITNDEHNVPRIPKVRDVMMSGRQPLTRLTVAELGVDAAALVAGSGYYEVVELRIPQRESNCEFVAGDSLEQQVENLAERLAGLAGTA
jgi:electron transfer flavoprotein beta subunit